MAIRAAPSRWPPSRKGRRESFSFMLSPAEFGAHLGEDFQMASVLAGEAQNEVGCPSPRIAIEPGGDALRGAGIDRLTAS